MIAWQRQYHLLGKCGKGRQGGGISGDMGRGDKEMERGKSGRGINYSTILSILLSINEGCREEAKNKGAGAGNVRYEKREVWIPLPTPSPLKWIPLRNCSNPIFVSLDMSTKLKCSIFLRHSDWWSVFIKFKLRQISFNETLKKAALRNLIQHSVDILSFRSSLDDVRFHVFATYIRKVPATCISKLYV